MRMRKLSSRRRVTGSHGFRAGARPWSALFEGTAGFFEAAVAETLEERERGG